ncbi:putative dynein intermediate chain [Trypanosoma conorhini]|uniref:Putative dynein intermediate chain n=1 Tax=Trypanosoma conorhini TaxID=83891 RepID=A0A3R7JW98_9TRYP|nr:putative dynein intermediate chain [Trypanosoma conorhini]RNE97835.1 putative dynein intermediate chain [Trypanosoma conorhini]
MDLAAKRRQLEEIRAAREAKQRSVQQQLQQRQQQSSRQKTSAAVVASSFACSSTPKSSMTSSVGGEPLQRAVSLSSVASAREEPHARNLQAASPCMYRKAARFTVLTALL